MKRAALSARPTGRAFSSEVPWSEADERAALGCVLIAGADGSQAEVDELLGQLRPSLFWDTRHQDILAAMVALRSERHAVDLVTVSTALMARNGDGKAALMLVSELPDATPSWQNFPAYLGTLQENALRRWTLGKRDRLAAMAMDPTLTLEILREEFSELADTAQKIGRPRTAALTAVRMSDHLRYQPAEALGLVGDTDVTKGYQGVTIIAGPPGSGKSLAAGSLAVAGAIGRGYWMGRQVHRQFRTLIVQCENGAMRLRKEFEAMAKHHPDVDFDSWVRVTLPPEGGLPFHRPEFRRELARCVEDFQPDVIVVDPWTAVAAEDSSKDIIDKLAEMRSILPPGDKCPALVIVAHTKKPRQEDKGNRGRALMFSVSGSQALVATARCVYVLLPFTDDIQDDRVLWACAKLSDSENPPADTVWHRRLGTLFRHCDDNPEDYWQEADKSDRQWLTLEMVEKAMANGRIVTQSRLAEDLADTYNQGSGKSTVHRLLKRPPFSDHLSNDGGLLSWKA